MAYMNRNRVLLFTNKFPYGIVETFIEAELESVPRNIELTIVPTQSHAENDKGRRVPEGIKIDNSLISQPKYEYPIKALQMLFSKDYHEEVKERRKNGKVSLTDRIHLLGYFGRAKQIADVILKKYNKADVVLYSYWASEASFAERLIKQVTGWTCVTRAHGTDVYDGQCVYGTIPGQRKAIEGIDKVYVCSKSGRDYLQAKYPTSKSKIDYAYLGTRDYGFKPLRNASDAFVIASCSRLVPVKRIHLIAEALKKIGGKRIHWIHIGDGPEREKLERVLKDVPENISVTLTGNMSHDEVMEYYKDHDIDLFINVSQSEGLPVSIMEVTSFGIPVIATDVGGTAEIVDKPTGVLIPQDFTTEQLVDCLEYFINMEPSALLQMRQSTRKFWEDNYAASKNYKLFYKQITQG